MSALPGPRYANAARKQEIAAEDRVLTRRRNLEEHLARHFEEVDRGARQRGEITEAPKRLGERMAPAWANWIQEVMSREAAALTAGRELPAGDAESLRAVLTDIAIALSAEAQVGHELARAYAVWAVEALIPPR